jgi:hypothetical protein
MDKLMICRELLRDFVLAEGAEVASGAWDDSRAMALAQAAFDAGTEAGFDVGYDVGYGKFTETYMAGRVAGYRECLDDYEITAEDELTEEDAHYWGGQ